MVTRRNLLEGGLSWILGPMLVEGLAGCGGAPPKARAISPNDGGAIPKQGMHLVTLGTKGGPTVRVDRIQPCNLLVVDGQPYVIDCGLGVTRQLVKAGVALSDCRIVFITHQHSDHNLEFGNLALSAWNANLTEPMTFYGPPPMVAMLRSYLELNAFDIDTRIADQGLPDLRNLVVAREITETGPIFQDARVRVSAARVNHPPIAQSYAFRFDTRHGSIVFSGDTTPTPSLTGLARGADWLVHEVLYLPSLEALLRERHTETKLRAHLLASHTTNEQVGRVAREAEVKHLVLSHLVSFGAVSDQEWIASCRGPYDGPIFVAHDGQMIF
ncbi:MAG TPA: MBL fold metallo-hydrolase [Polyangiaceae bacterium]|nr:MBL fold metallo-hydrolase [Polyangiaceae bacterium]